MSGDESPQRENEMDSPSFEGFHAQLDCKLTIKARYNKPIRIVVIIVLRVVRFKIKIYFEN